MHQLKEIFQKITERFELPIRVGSRCEANTYYRVDELTPEDLEICATYVADRILKVCHPSLPIKLVNLPGGYTGLADMLSDKLAPHGETIEVVPLDILDPNNGTAHEVRNMNIVLVNDVITTARSCLEAHTKTTMMGANVLCWAALIDRTFGPGPVPVVTAFTGDPVRLLEDLP